jgi:hypothetical protein
VHIYTLIPKIFISSLLSFTLSAVLRHTGAHSEINADDESNVDVVDSIFCTIGSEYHIHSRCAALCGATVVTSVSSFLNTFYR